MKAYVERMIEEREGLEGRMRRLSADFPYVTDEELKILMRDQLRHMNKYAGILDRRIEIAAEDGDA
jgi:hypothetical protein